MVNIIIVAHNEIAKGFVHCIKNIIDTPIDYLHTFSIKNSEKNIEDLLLQVKDFVNNIAVNSEVLILVDLYGATPSNIASQLASKDKIEVITGLNLPMLIRAISYAKNGLKICVNKALEGAKSGIMHIV
ncbi:MAG TPA: hypothetical protein PKD00_10195 [Burkholderiales bacterium]|nr:hypothetical protein [Burkholderiales bacterium]